MTEEEYAKFANERRQKYGGFVVGEEGDEYVPTRPDGFQIPSLPRGHVPTTASATRFEIAFSTCAALRRAARRGAARASRPPLTDDRPDIPSLSP